MSMRCRLYFTPSAREQSASALVFALVVVVVIVGGGCVARPRSRLTPETTKNIVVSEEQLRLRVRSLLEPLCGRLERQANAVIAGTDDRNVKLAALSWEIEAVPQLRQALYQPDPITATVDALALCNQMADYFATGPGEQAMGPASAECAATCRAMADGLAKAMSAITRSGDTPKLRAFAAQWAADHPIRGSIAERESAVARMSDYLSAEGLSTGETFAEATTTLDDLNRKLEVYSDQLPRQARWEVERLKLQTVAELRLDQAIPLAGRAVESADGAVKSADQVAATVDRLSEAIERFVNVAEDTPALVASQREQAVSAVHDEVSRALQFAREERIAATTDLNGAFVEQRKLIAGEADQIAARQIDYAVRQVTRLVALALTAAVVMALVGVLLARRLPPRRTRNAHTEREGKGTPIPAHAPSEARGHA